MSAPMLVSVGIAARILGVSRARVRQWTDAGKLAYVPVERTGNLKERVYERAVVEHFAAVRPRRPIGTRTRCVTCLRPLTANQQRNRLARCQRQACRGGKVRGRPAGVDLTEAEIDARFEAAKMQQRGRAA